MKKERTLPISPRVNPEMAGTAQGHQVLKVKTKLFVVRPRDDVMRMKRIASVFTGATSLASETIARQDCGQSVLPSLRSIEPLSLRCDAPPPRGITSPTLTANMRSGRVSSFDPGSFHSLRD